MGRRLQPNNTAGRQPRPAAEIASRQCDLTLTSAGSGTCSPESDAVVWTFTFARRVPVPIVIPVANNADAMLNGSFTVATGAVWSGGGGSFSPSPTNMGATYTPTPAEMRLRAV